MTASRRATAATTVGVPPEKVFGFLADLRNHWRIAGRWIEVVALHPPDGPADGATVRLRGPLGLARMVRTSVDEAIAPSILRGHAQAGPTRAEVRWQLDRRSGGAHVTVTVALASAGRFDRLLWHAGGRLWLRSRLARTVGMLDGLVPEGVHATANALDATAPA